MIVSPQACRQVRCPLDVRIRTGQRWTRGLRTWLRGEKALRLRGKHAMERPTLLSYQVTGAQSAWRAQARNMIMSNACPDHPRDRGCEPVNACSIEVQQPRRAWPTVTNLYHPPPRAERPSATPPPLATDLKVGGSSPSKRASEATDQGLAVGQRARPIAYLGTVLPRSGAARTSKC